MKNIPILFALLCLPLFGQLPTPYYASGNSYQQLTGSGDVGAAINAALTNCASTGCVIDATGWTLSGSPSTVMTINKAAVVRLPPGTVTNRIVISASTVELWGAGEAISGGVGTLIAPASGVSITIGASAPIFNIHVHNLTTVGYATCISVNPSGVNYVSAFSIEKVSCLDATGDGIYISNSSYNFVLRDVDSTYNGGYGIHLDGVQGGAQTSEAELDNVYLLGNTLDQFYANATLGLLLNHLSAAGATTGYYGIHLMDTQSTTIIEPWLEGNAGYMLFQSCHGVTVTGGYLNQTGTQKGLVIGFDATPNYNQDWSIDIPSWINTSSATRVDDSLHTTGTYGIQLLRHGGAGATANPFQPSDVLGFGTNYPVHGITFPLLGEISTPYTGTSGTATCSQASLGFPSLISCQLNGYANTGTAQTYVYPQPMGFLNPILTIAPSGSCGTYNPTATYNTITLPANAGMTAETCQFTVVGQ